MLNGAKDDGTDSDDKLLGFAIPKNRTYQAKQSIFRLGLEPPSNYLFIQRHSIEFYELPQKPKIALTKENEQLQLILPSETLGNAFFIKSIDAEYFSPYLSLAIGVSALANYSDDQSLHPANH